MCEGVVLVMCEGVVVVMCEGVVVVMCEGVVVVMCGCSGSAALYTQVLYVRAYILLGSFINCLALPIRMYVCTHFGIESCRNVQFESFFSLFTIYMLCIHKKTEHSSWYHAKIVWVVCTHIYIRICTTGQCPPSPCPGLLVPSSSDSRGRTTNWRRQWPHCGTRRPKRRSWRRPTRSCTEGHTTVGGKSSS